MSEADELAMASRVAAAVAATYEAGAAEIFAAAHDHEELPEGAASVAWEGGTEDWAINWPFTPEAEALAAELGVWFEPIYSFMLAIYPSE